MLHVMLSLRNTLGITVEAAHFNHQLRGEESDRDEAFVRTLCAELGVVLHVDNGDVRARAAKTHESVEEAARALRYALIATAHTQDDNLETVLLNLTRGTGLAGLCGIPPRRERFIRPMLAVSRAEIEAYLAQNGLSHVTDSTNFLPDARRNRLRQSVIPLLKAENPSLCETAFRMCRLLEADEAQLSAQAEAALRQARLSDGIRCSALTAYPAAVRTRAVRLLLGEIHAPKLSERHISAVDRLLFSECPSARASLPGGFLAQREYDRLLLTAGSPAAFEPVTLLAGESAVLQPLGLRVCCEWQENFSEIQNTLSTFAVKCDTIGSTTQILFRPRRAHDEMRVSGGRKTLKKLMIDRKIPLDRRRLLPVAADEHGILGVYGIGVNLDRAPRLRANARSSSQSKKQRKRIRCMINKSDMLQDIERVLVSEEEIHARIKEVGAQIAEDYRGKCPILVGVLKGVVPFFAEMANAISIPVQEDFMCITSFEGGTESTGKLTFRKDIDHDIEGRHVLILEDIIDSGSTLKMICEMFRERKPASIRICTLLDKPTGRKVDLKPDYTCFTVPPAFVVGFGLDYEDYYRNLPFVGVLKPSVYQDQ